MSGSEYGEANLELVLELARRLSPVEKIRLIEQVAPEIESDLVGAGVVRGVSLLGVARDLGPSPSSDEIDSGREEAWTSFPPDLP